jgi:COMPASS component SWD3
MWDTATGQCLRTLVHEDNAPVVGVRFSPNGKYVLAWTLDSCIRLWNYVDGRAVKTYQGHVNAKFSIGGAFGAYGTPEYPFAFIASGSEDGSVWLWDVGTKNVLQKIEGAHQGVVLGVDTHPTEPLMVSGGADRTVRVWRYDGTAKSAESAILTQEDQELQESGD